MKLATSIRSKLLLPIIGILFPILLIGFIFLYTVSRNQQISNINGLADYKMKMIQGGIRNIADKSLSIASSFTSIEGIENAYLMKDETAGRNLLRSLPSQPVKNITDNTGIKNLKIHYHKPPAMSFVRLWRKPGEKDGGDDLSSFRNSVIDISKNHSPIASIEIGRGGPEIRGIAPIFSRGSISLSGGSCQFQRYNASLNKKTPFRFF
jgi:methyl-accepting chemotaxis protein